MAYLDHSPSPIKLVPSSVLCPSRPDILPIRQHNATKSLNLLAAATILYNIVDSPVGVLPVLRLDPAKDKLSEEWRKSGLHGAKPASIGSGR